MEKSNKSYKIFNLIPAVGFAVFAVLMVVFMCALPVAGINALGLKENFGTILSGTRFDEIVGLNSLSLTLIIVGLVTVLYAVALLINKLTVLKYRKVLGKPLYRLMEVIAVVFVLVHLVFACLVISKVNAADGGVGIIKVGAYSILTIVLSVVYLVAFIVSMVSTLSYEKANPELLANLEEEGKKVKEERKESLAKKAAKKAGKKSSKYLIFTAVFAVFMVLSIGPNSPISKVVQRYESALTFDANELKSLLVNDAGSFNVSKYQIETAIGNSYVPTGSTEDKENVVYYTENFVELAGKGERNAKYLLLAIEQGDERISGLLKQAKNLEEEFETLAYGQAEIKYSKEGYLKEVVYNAVTIEGMGSISKKLDNVKVFNVVETSAGTDTKKIERLAYLATYTDGSFVYARCENVAVVLENGTTSTTYEGSYVGKIMKWTDTFGSYEVVGTANN